MASGGSAAIETDRLVLRSPIPEDASIWAKFLETDADFLKYVPTRASPPAERSERTVRQYVERPEQHSLAMGWSVTLKDDRSFIGFAGVDALSDTEGEIEYFLARPYWGRGYGSDVAEAVTDHWFSTTDGTRLVAFVIPENVGSVRAVAKLGYERTGSVNYLDLMGNPPGVTLESPIADEYSLSRDDWSARHGS